MSVCSSGSSPLAFIWFSLYVIHLANKSSSSSTPLRPLVNVRRWLCVDAGMHCTECGYNCHEKCVQNVPKNCTKLRPASHLTSLSADQSAAAAGGGGANVQQSAAQSGTDATLVGLAVNQSAVSTSAGTACALILLFRVPTGQGKLEKVREFECSGKGQGKIFFVKIREKSGKIKNWCHRMSDFQAKMHQICYPLGSAPDSAPPDSLVALNIAPNDVS